MFDKAAIMREVWALVRRANLARFPLRFLLRNALRTAWTKAKTERRYALDRARRANPVSLAIRTIEAKERLTAADYAALDLLRRRAA